MHELSLGGVSSASALKEKGYRNLAPTGRSQSASLNVASKFYVAFKPQSIVAVQKVHMRNNLPLLWCRRQQKPELTHVGPPPFDPSHNLYQTSLRIGIVLDISRVTKYTAFIDHV